MSIISYLLVFCYLVETTAFSSSNIEETYCEFSLTQKILEKKTLEDFGNNSYVLYELDGGYAIYFDDGNEETFLEGSYETNSPYYGLDSSESYYLGPGCYFYGDGGHVYDILSTKTYSKSDLGGLSSITSDGVASLEKGNIKTNGASSDTNPGKDTSDYPEQYSDYYLIKDYYYFQNLSYFPDNYLGTCGIVSLAMLLGYCDTFYNDNFIPKDLVHDFKTYDEEDNLISATKNADVIKSATLKYNESYIKNGDYPTKNWDDYPGVTQALHDYLLDECLSYNTILSWFFGGYPMTQTKIKKTCENYVKEVCPTLSNDITYRYNNINISGETIPLLLNEVMDYLDNDMPVILVMLMYNIKDEGFYFGHDAIAYGYNKKGQLLMHLGWNANGKIYSSIVVNPNIPYGYFAIDYAGEHVHSANAKCPKNLTSVSTYGVCGCGYIDNTALKLPDTQLA